MLTRAVSKLVPYFVWVRKQSLWFLFVGSLVFLALGSYFFQQANVESEFGLDGEKPSAYAKDRAAARAMVKLVRYCQRYNIPVDQFRGPYFQDVLGLNYPAYIVSFNHPDHYFFTTIGPIT